MAPAVLLMSRGLSRGGGGFLVKLYMERKWYTKYTFLVMCSVACLNLQCSVAHTQAFALIQYEAATALPQARVQKRILFSHLFRAFLMPALPVPGKGLLRYEMDHKARGVLAF